MTKLFIPGNPHENFGGASLDTSTIIRTTPDSYTSQYQPTARRAETYKATQFPPIPLINLKDHHIHQTLYRKMAIAHIDMFHSPLLSPKCSQGGTHPPSLSIYYDARHLTSAGNQYNNNSN